MKSSQLIMTAVTVLISALPNLAQGPTKVMTATDHYKLIMRLEVPRVYNNTTSEGYSKYKRDLIYGDMYITYYDDTMIRPEITVKNLVNKSHKLSNGNLVTYKCWVGLQTPMTRVNVIGNNKTGVFKYPSVVFHLTAEPNYNVGDLGDDNVISVTMASRGWSTFKNDSKYGNSAYFIRKLLGAAAGQMGCGCSAYGHTSPTRVQGMYGATDVVDDVRATMGRWYAIAYDGEREFSEEDIEYLANELDNEDM